MLNDETVGEERVKRDTAKADELTPEKTLAKDVRDLFAVVFALERHAIEGMVIVARLLETDADLGLIVEAVGGSGESGHF